MTAVIQAQGLGKRYGHGRRWALRDCTLDIPAGRVVGLVGPNGAGKTTLLQLTVGLLTPTSGSIRVLGSRPAANPAQLGSVGFVAQDSPTYAGLSIADHLRLGARLNPGWTMRWHASGSDGSAWTSPAGRGSCWAGSAPSSPSPWASPSGPSC